MLSKCGGFNVLFSFNFCRVRFSFCSFTYWSHLKVWKGSWERLCLERMIFNNTLFVDALSVDKEVVIYFIFKISIKQLNYFTKKILQLFIFRYKITTYSLCFLYIQYIGKISWGKGWRIQHITNALVNEWLPALIIAWRTKRSAGRNEEFV